MGATMDGLIARDGALGNGGGSGTFWLTKVARNLRFMLADRAAFGILIKRLQVILGSQLERGGWCSFQEMRSWKTGSPQ